MTREHAKELLPIITAFANGETVQFRIDGTWHTGGVDADFDFSLNPLDYRIKPNPREFYVSLTVNGDVHDCGQDIEKLGRMGLGTIVKVREILD